jgi:hypothetical protein
VLIPVLRISIGAPSNIPLLCAYPDFLKLILKPELLQNDPDRPPNIPAEHDMGVESVNGRLKTNN